jgi:hypothetical protein
MLGKPISPPQTPPVRQGRLCTGGPFRERGAVRREFLAPPPCQGRDGMTNARAMTSIVRYAPSFVNVL